MNLAKNQQKTARIYQKIKKNIWIFGNSTEFLEILTKFCKNQQKLRGSQKIIEKLGKIIEKWKKIIEKWGPDGQSLRNGGK